MQKAGSFGGRNGKRVKMSGIHGKSPLLIVKRRPTSQVKASSKCADGQVLRLMYVAIFWPLQPDKPDWMTERSASCMHSGPLKK